MKNAATAIVAAFEVTSDTLGQGVILRKAASRPQAARRRTLR